mmetsp:Transcript_18920/g.30088  ORF Transcript_18920/g.30088 Transcript_18920/m.30088 type:complete len:85 (-) Transcript_18920:128-382(-)
MARLSSFAGRKAVSSTFPWRGYSSIKRNHHHNRKIVSLRRPQQRRNADYNKKYDDNYGRDEIYDIHAAAPPRTAAQHQPNFVCI